MTRIRDTSPFPQPFHNGCGIQHSSFLFFFFFLLSSFYVQTRESLVREIKLVFFSYLLLLLIELIKSYSQIKSLMYEPKSLEKSIIPYHFAHRHGFSPQIVLQSES